MDNAENQGKGKMSEHITIKGNIEFDHLPEGEEGSFTFCNRCKKTKRKCIIHIHQGICSEWMEFVCPRCKKTIWVTEFDKREAVKDDKKCSVCKKPTNHYDCVSHSISWNKKRKKHEDYFCSEKCEKIWEKKYEQ